MRDEIRKKKIQGKERRREVRGEIDEAGRERGEIDKRKKKRGR